MHITLSPVPLEEKPILERLMQLYLYDFTEFDEDDVDEQGLYAYPVLPRNWEEPNRRPFFIRVEGKLAGFVLIRLGIEGLIEPHPVNTIAEFFVLKKYRKYGVGAFAARWVFDQFPGDWEIEELVNNLPAQIFWRKIVNRYTNGNFREITHKDEHYPSIVQTFTNL